MIFYTQDEVIQHIGQHIPSGRYKDCDHLGIGREMNYFYTRCALTSLLPDYSDPNSHCLPNCTLFASRLDAIARRQEEQEKANRILRHERRMKFSLDIGNAFLKMIKWPFEYFAKLSAPVQMLILLAIILALAPKWTPRLIEVIKAIRGLP